MMIEPLEPGSNRTLLSAATANELIWALNALLNLEVKRGSKDMFHVADGNAVLELKRSAADGTEATGTASVAMFLLKSVQGDYLTCRTWDGVNEGSTDVYIAKDPRLRNSVTSEVLDGVTVSYSYTSTTIRVASWTIDSVADEEIQHVVPHYLPDTDPEAGEVIFAVQTAHTGVTVGEVELIWLEMSNGKAWARSYLQ